MIFAVCPTMDYPLRGWSIFQPGLDCLVQRPIPLVADVLHLSRVFVHLLGRLPPEVATVNFRFVVAIPTVVVLVHGRKQKPRRSVYSLLAFLSAAPVRASVLICGRLFLLLVAVSQRA